MKIQVKVITRSKVEGVSQQGDIFLVRVKEPPKEGKANAAVIRAVARHFGVAQSSVRILSGHSARTKVIGISL